jgi:hypothetical protein
MDFDRDFGKRSYLSRYTTLVLVRFASHLDYLVNNLFCVIRPNKKNDNLNVPPLH